MGAPVAATEAAVHDEEDSRVDEVLRALLHAAGRISATCTRLSMTLKNGSVSAGWFPVIVASFPS